MGEPAKEENDLSTYLDPKEKRKSAPPHVKEFLEKDEAVDHIVESTKLHHSDIYLQAAKEAGIWDETEQKVQYDKLDDVKTQDTFLDEMVRRYVDAAKNASGFQEADLDDRHKDMLMQEYFGVTKGALKGLLREHGSRYTHDSHVGVSKENFVKSVEKRLRGAAVQHLEKEHIDDLIEHAEIPDGVLKEKPHSPEEAAQLARMYDREGPVGYNTLKRALPKEYLASD